jgi:hypothetical protein
MAATKEAVAVAELVGDKNDYDKMTQQAALESLTKSDISD